MSFILGNLALLLYPTQNYLRLGTEIKATTSPSRPPPPTTRSGFTAGISMKISAALWTVSSPTICRVRACGSRFLPLTAMEIA